MRGAATSGSHSDFDLVGSSKPPCTRLIALFVLPAATYTAKVPHDILGYFEVMHRLGMG